MRSFLLPNTMPSIWLAPLPMRGCADSKRGNDSMISDKRKPMTTPPEPWRDCEEMTFLNGIGSWCKETPNKDTPAFRTRRIRLLRNYLAASINRNWGLDMHGERCLAYARSLLQIELSAQPPKPLAQGA